MALKGLKQLFSAPSPRITREEAMKVFKRDHFKCQYCGLDGLHRFENWLVMTIDHVHPHARGGARSMNNLVTACQPCNILKGKRLFASREEAKKYVLAKREEWRHLYHEQVKAVGTAHASH
jgi:5-methylcytosine-specific restriction endonuclease McrA